MTRILPVIMCGGSGTRLWPESRESLPKQFISLFGALSTFQTTLKNFGDCEVFETPIVLTSANYRFLVAEQLAHIGMDAEIVLEPVRRDSAAAVAVAAELAALRSPETIVAVLASDHVIQAPKRLNELCKLAGLAASKGAIVTIGIKPSHPATEYGYIRTNGSFKGSEGVKNVAAYFEKPPADAAARYIAEGCLWNSGNFFFRADVMQREIQRFEPDIARAAAEAVAYSKPEGRFLRLDTTAFESAPSKSIDYAVMEHTTCACVVPADIGWSDVGSWSSMLDLCAHDANGNSVQGNGMALDSSHVLVRSDGPLTAVIGLSNIIVVATADAVLVVDSKQAHKVKTLVAQLKAAGRPESIQHKRISRPWGDYVSIDAGERHQVKRITVKPHGLLSLQKHFHRAEHWIVVRGTAEVTLDDEVSLVHENQSIYLPMGAVHRLYNPGKIDLELIEVQTGSYLGEDDIVRMEDIYHRV